MNKNDPARCDAHLPGAGLYFPRCPYRWLVRVTERNGDVSYVCRVHLRPLVRQGLAVEITSRASRDR